MSLSKSVRRCNKCLCISTRKYNTRSPPHDRFTSHGTGKVSETYRKTMSISYWKLLNQLREYLTKSPIDRGVFLVLNKEWIKLMKKLPLLNSELQKTEQQSSASPVSTSPLIKSNYNTDVHIESAVLRNQSNAEPKVIPEDTSQTTDNVCTKWKPSTDIVSQRSISSRTKHVLSSISSAESVLSRLKRLSDLTSHLNQYPEAKHLVVKEGGIGTLLRLREQTQDEETHATIREALAILGYIEPLRSRGIRILSIDGGGIRGVLVIEMLKKLEQLTGKRVHEMFDFICGVSTGAILACVVGAQRKTLDEVSELYKELSTKIFTQNPILGTSSLVWNHSYYSTEMWEKLLKAYVGEKQLIKTARDPNCPKIAVVSAIVNQPRVQAFIFRNYSLPYRVHSQYAGGYQHALWEAARASAAAPSYFEEFRLGEYLHQDGGILVNNPCAVAIHEAKHLWPGSQIQCIISFGTGRSKPISSIKEESSVSSWKTKFLKILDSATDTEAVHTMLNDLLPPNVYYRFNPYLTEMLSMVEINPEKIRLLEMDAEMYFRRNEETFWEAASALLERKSLGQRCQHWLGLKSQLLGVK